VLAEDITTCDSGRIADTQVLRTMVGGEFNCAPTAKVDDGLIDVCYFRAMSLLRLLLLIPHYRKGDHIGCKAAGKRVLFRQAREVTISSKDLIDIYIDGEQLPGSHFDLKILPGALPLRLPKRP